MGTPTLSRVTSKAFPWNPCDQSALLSRPSPLHTSTSRHRQKAQVHGGCSCRNLWGGDWWDLFYPEYVYKLRTFQWFPVLYPNFARTQPWKKVNINFFVDKETQISYLTWKIFGGPKIRALSGCTKPSPQVFQYTVELWDIGLMQSMCKVICKMLARQWHLRKPQQDGQ